MMWSFYIRTARRLCEDLWGVAAVEFALIANVFILLVAGMTGFGMYLSASHSLQQISAEAARSAIGGLTVEEQTQLAAAYITQHGGEYPFLVAENIQSSVTHPSSSIISVSVSYSVADLPVMGMLTGTPLPKGTITASSSLRLGAE